MNLPSGPCIALVEKYGFGVFVETGTYNGATTNWAAERFKKVYTFEAEHGIYRAYLFSKPDNVDAIFGKSEDMLPDLLERLNEPAVFWLDAHWSSGNTFEGVCPLEDELKAIAAHPFDHAVFVDDISLFTPQFEAVKPVMLNIGYKVFRMADTALFLKEKHLAALEAVNA